MSRYLEDINPGDVFESPHRTISLDEILAFAREFDSQPFHLDPEAAKHSFFGTLIASGWHTAALTMRMLNEAGMDLADGIIGAGADQLALARAVAAGRPDLRARRDHSGARFTEPARDRRRAHARPNRAR